MEDYAEAHLYSQSCWHDDGFIIGTEEGLRKVIDCINLALKHKTATAELFTGDGEGYTLRVVLTNSDKLALVRTPYTDELAADNRSNAIQPWQLFKETCQENRDQFS